VKLSSIVSSSDASPYNTNTCSQILSRSLVISKRQQEALKLNNITGEPNLMTSHDFDTYCVNDTFYLGRGPPRPLDANDFFGGISSSSDR
jgi:hypothetical protein